jgi:hypothetical protein
MRFQPASFLTLCLTGCGKSTLFCHSERSEESLFDLSHEKKERFLVSLGMTIFWRCFFRSLLSVPLVLSVTQGIDGSFATPTSVARIGTTAWVSEGQLAFFFDASKKNLTPSLPFRIYPVLVRKEGTK